MKQIIYVASFVLIFYVGNAKSYASNKNIETNLFPNDSSICNKKERLLIKYYNTNQFVDAAYNSIMALNSLIKKENYRNKVATFNNPTNNDLGFSLNNEIQLALKPLINKASSNNSNKLSSIIGSVLNNQNFSAGFLKNLFNNNNSIFNTVTSIVGSWAMQEKKITKNDFDTFLLIIGKYFGQYEKLNKINFQLDNGLDKLDVKVNDLQNKLKHLMSDVYVALNPNLLKSTFDNKTIEETLILFSDKQSIDSIIKQNINTTKSNTSQASFIELKLNKSVCSYFPFDAIKTSKEIVNEIIKINQEYQKIYIENYMNLQKVLEESKTISQTINTQKVDHTLSELLVLYNESKKADVLNLRIVTLNERLKSLVMTENMR